MEFAARVKADICKKGGLVDLPWYVRYHVTLVNMHMHCLVSTVFGIGVPQYMSLLDRAQNQLHIVSISCAAHV